MLSPLETFILCDFIAIKHNWTTVINWHFGDGGAGNKKKKKKIRKKPQYCYFQQPQRAFLLHFIKFLHFSYWQSLKDYLVMGVEEKSTVCILLPS